MAECAKPRVRAVVWHVLPDRPMAERPCKKSISCALVLWHVVKLASEAQPPSEDVKDVANPFPYCVARFLPLPLVLQRFQSLPIECARLLLECGKLEEIEALRPVSPDLLQRRLEIRLKNPQCCRSLRTRAPPSLVLDPPNQWAADPLYG